MKERRGRVTGGCWVKRSGFERRCIVSTMAQISERAVQEGLLTDSLRQKGVLVVMSSQFSRTKPGLIFSTYALICVTLLCF